MHHTDVRGTEPSGGLDELRGARLVDFDGDDLAGEHRRLAPGRGAEVERALARTRPHVPDELRAAALRPDAALCKRRLVDAVDDPGAGDERVLTTVHGAANEAHGGLGLVVLRAHQRPCVVRAELAPPRLGHPVGVRVAQRRLGRGALGERGAERAGAVREPAQDGVRERHRSSSRAARTSSTDSLTAA